MTGSFTDLRIWQIAHTLTLEIYILTRVFPKSEAYGLVDQMRRAAVSVVSNIAEGHGRYHTKDIVRFLIDARASIFEVQAQLLIAKDLHYCESDKVDALVLEYSDLAKQINGFISYKKKVGL